MSSASNSREVVGRADARRAPPNGPGARHPRVALGLALRLGDPVRPRLAAARACSGSGGGARRPASQRLPSSTTSAIDERREEQPDLRPEPGPEDAESKPTRVVPDASVQRSMPTPASRMTSRTMTPTAAEPDPAQDAADGGRPGAVVGAADRRRRILRRPAPAGAGLPTARARAAGAGGGRIGVGSSSARASPSSSSRRRPSSSVRRRRRRPRRRPRRARRRPVSSRGARGPRPRRAGAPAPA